MKLRTCVVLAYVGVTGTSFAQEKAVQDIPPGEDQITAVRKGEPTPYDGQVFSNPTALRWANWLKQYDMKLKLSSEYERKVCTAEVTYRDKLLEIEKQKYSDVVTDYQVQSATKDVQIQQLQAEVSSPAWYRTPWFGFVVGVAVTSAAVTAGYVSGR